MIEVTYRIDSRALVLRGWRHLWCKKVVGFDTANHCARCLIGTWENRFGLKAPINETVRLTGYKDGDLLYFCGVAAPWNWANNAHLAGRVTKGASSSIELHTGDRLTVEGLQQIAIDPEPAKLRFPDRDRSFLTCRNFQFAAQMFKAA